MRIRKRLLSLYGAVTAPALLDLRGGGYNQPPPQVQQQELHPNENQCHPPPPPSSANHTTQIGLQPNTRASLGDSSDRNKTEILEPEKMKQPIKTDCRKDTILCAEEKNHDLVMKGWLQGDCLVPTKKKRGSYGRRLNNDVVQDDGMVESTMKLKDTKKHTKKEKKEGVIMEGSRCSRVNGRGWRCSQQTLVGYSLCEHHLGKGRVRNMSTSHVRTQKIARKDKSPSIDHDEIKDDDNDDDDDDDDEEFEDWDVESMSSMEGTKVFSKKTKLGVVKARSLSSLLSQISS